MKPEDFDGLDLDGLPPLPSLPEDDLLRSLWVLWVAKERLGQTTATAHQVSVVLTDVYGVHIPRQRIQALLDRQPPSGGGTPQGGGA
jgi:hypothetical protein